MRSYHATANLSFKGVNPTQALEIATASTVIARDQQDFKVEVEVLRPSIEYVGDGEWAAQLNLYFDAHDRDEACDIAQGCARAVEKSQLNREPYRVGAEIGNVKEL